MYAARVSVVLGVLYLQEKAGRICSRNTSILTIDDLNFQGSDDVSRLKRRQPTPARAWFFVDSTDPP